MNLSINGKGCDIGQSLQQHIEERLPPAVEKYFEKVTDIAVIVSKERSFFQVNINVHLWRGMMLQAHGKSVDVYGAFGEALEHMGKRLRRNKRRLRNHQSKDKHEPILQAQHYVLSPESGEDEADDNDNVAQEPMIIAEMQASIETMSVSEAVMVMDLAGLNALMFKNSKHGGLSMVYARKDGHIGWIDPKQETGA